MIVMIREMLSKRSVQVALTLLLLAFLAIPLPSPLFPDDYSAVVLDRENKILRAFLNTEEQWCLPPRDDLIIPEKLKTAVLLFEDQYFYYHPGINPVAMARAFFQNISRGERISGASTITMQVARLMQPKQRTYMNKVLEILQAQKIDALYSKEEILRTYLNHAPYGGNIIGYQAAALRYFQKMPEQLTWAESATLAVLPNAPGLISPDVNSDQLEEKRNYLLKKLWKKGIIDDANYELALLEKIPRGSVPFSMQAPHLARYLKNREKAGLIETTLDGNIQENVAELLNRHIRYLSEQGIFNGAALVANTQSGEVVAYVGSQDFFDIAHDGQVDGVRAARSSGSLLKPFLYALSIDEGIVVPQTLLKDVPTYYGSFSPRNASETFDGITSAQSALTRSLNVPAARLLYTYGVHPFYLYLQSNGMSTLFRSANDYGLPLILGGAETTLWDMVKFYRGLGAAGKITPIKILKNPAKVRTGAQVEVSPMASYMTLNMLRDLKRPGSEYYWEQYNNQWPLAWKTGTSYGQRDAWAVGVSPQWTIAVWVGNFNGEGNANLGGAKSAGPLLFDIFNYLPKAADLAWFSLPESDRVSLEICRDTGFRASGDCPEKEAIDVPRFMKPLRLCPYHNRIFLANNRQYQVCSLCWESGEYFITQRLVYPPDVVQYLRGRGEIVYDIPPHHPDCPAQNDQKPLQILYPQENARLWVPRDFGGELQKIVLKTAHRQDDVKIYWYLNEHYLGSTEDRHEMAVSLEKGWHVLEVVDERGFRDKKRFYTDLR